MYTTLALPLRFTAGTCTLGVWLLVGCSTPVAPGDGTLALGDAAFEFPEIQGGKSDTGKADAGKAAPDAADAAKTDAGTPAVDAVHEVGQQDVVADAAVDDGGENLEDVANSDAGGDDAPGDDDAADGGETADPFAQLCDPCVESAACNGGTDGPNLCLSTGPGGSFCGVACDPTATEPCPGNYVCVLPQDVTPAGSHQCLPISKQCTCSVAAALAKLSTTCTVTNELGTCTGKRSCGIQGLGFCTAVEAVPEICNGIDDNCDGTTDEGLCAAAMCMAGTCDSVTGVCAPAPTGELCDDGNNCTTADACSFGTCVGTSTGDGDDTAPGQALANKSDCDGSSKTTSILAPGTDVDWFTFKADDDLFCSIVPTVRIDQMAGDYDLCVYWACGGGGGGAGDQDCDQGTEVSGGPNGWHGCCSSNTGTTADKVKIDTTCSTLGLGDDGGTAIIRVTAHNPKAVNICGGYTLTWSAESF